MRSREELELVLALARDGLNRCEISRATAIPRSTVTGWLAGRLPRSSVSAEPPWTLPDFPREAYSYLLGLYLGDGYIAAAARTTSLRIFLDARYPGIIGGCFQAIRRVRPGNRVSVFRQRPTRCVIVQCWSQLWPALFPQHGAGMKHERTIELADWQLAITTEHPQSLLRGLIHSDGCRFTNPVRVRGKRYAYPRYQFSNASDEIRAIFCSHLSLLGIAWRPSGLRVISVARRESVAKLDEFVGPKR